jgi:acyl-CoA dehydrogenase
MHATVEKRADACPQATQDWRDAIAELGPRFAARAAAHDESGDFVAANIAELKAAGLTAAAVPVELGGLGLDQAGLAAMLQSLARYCASTALALSMHTHLVAALAFRWRGDGKTGEPVLRRVAAEGIGLVSSGGSDWLDGSCRAEPVDGGFRIHGRKIFASGAPAGDMMMTMAVLSQDDGDVVLHFAMPMDAAGVRRLDNWDTLGMRGTGSVDIELDGVFVPEAAVSVRRPVGVWHPAMHFVTKVAFPLIYAVYVGIAEAARDRAVALVGGRARADFELIVGEIETELAAARLALADMLTASQTGEPGPETTNRVMIGRTLVARAAIATVEKAMEPAGGAAFHRKTGLERLFRDVQAARYHPLQPRAQARLAGRLALGLDIDG